MVVPFVPVVPVPVVPVPVVPVPVVPVPVVPSPVVTAAVVVPPPAGTFMKPLYFIQSQGAVRKSGFLDAISLTGGNIAWVVNDIQRLPLIKLFGNL